MMRKLLLIGLLAALVGFCALVGLVNEMAGSVGRDAVRNALNSAPDNQRVTAVCVGVNIGSCNTRQASTSTRTAGDGDGIPWPAKLLAVAVICPLLLGGTIWLCRDTEEW